MDKRRKILVVEDHRLYRESLVDNLEEEGYRVEACKSLTDACEAIAALSFDLALVDIMLNGPSDLTNRDGLQVLANLRDLGEGTRAVALTAQSHDGGLVRKILKDFHAVDFIIKQEIGRAALLKKVQSEIKSKPRHAQALEWRSLVRALAPEVDEIGFVGHILRDTSFTGGQRILQDSLFEATKWLVPLLPLASVTTPGTGPSLPGIFVGVFWSKGQGCAVEISVQGKGKEGESSRSSGPLHSELYRRTKGGLTTIVLARPDLQRSSFVNR